MALITKDNYKHVFVLNSVGKRVFFHPEGTQKLFYGTVIGRGDDPKVFTVEDDEHNRYSVPSENIFASKDAFLSEKGLKEFDCEVFMERHWSIFKTVIAETLEDSIASLKEEYPNAYSIREVDPWR